MKASFKTGAIALAFLVLGFELALFVHRAAVERVVANRDRPDTVYVVQGAGSRVSGPQADRFAAPPSRAGPLPLHPWADMASEGSTPSAAARANFLNRWPTNIALLSCT